MLGKAEARVTHRDDIDVLRGVAIGAVMAFHAAPGLVPGGFLGVDAFLVISGYLLMRSLHPDEGPVPGGRAMRVLTRRLRRLAPAACATVIGTLALGWWVFLPETLARTAETGGLGLIFASNLAAPPGGYFDRTAPDALGHLWSLGLEMQLYVVLACIVCVIGGARRTVTGLVVLCGASFVYALVGQEMFAQRVYYDPAARFWQIGLGVAVAGVVISRPWRRRIASVIWCCAVAIVAASVTLASGDLSQPGWESVPVVGTTLLCLVVGLEAPRPGGAARAAWAGLAWAGRHCYGLYLAHYPILVLSAHWSPSTDLPDAVRICGVLAASLGCAAILRAGLERPGAFRRVSLAVGWPVAACLAGWITVSGGAPGRVPADIRAVAGLAPPFTSPALACHFFPDGSFRYDRTCLHGGPGAVRTVLWGDSHAAGLAAGALAGPPVAAFRQVSINGCLPLREIARTDWRRRDCLAAQAQAFDAILSDPRVAHVVISAYWQGAADTPLARDGIKGAARGRDTAPAAAIADDLAGSVARLLDAGKRVSLVAPAPDFARHVPRAMAHDLWSGADGSFDVDAARQTERRTAARELLAPSRQLTGVRWIAVRDLLCAPGPPCPSGRDGWPWYFDTDHLTPPAAREVARRALSAPVVSTDR